MRRKLLSLLCLGLAAGCKAPEPAASPRIVVIGLDGADWEPVGALIEAGRLPNLQAMVEGGGAAVLHTVEPMLSPMLWTSIATGRTPPEHGILDFFAVDDAGRRVPVPSYRRRVPALWNIVGDRGQQVAFVGWQVTHPAERVAGVMVSDRVLALADPEDPAGRGAVYPAALEPELAARVVLPDALPDSLLARFLPGEVPAADPLRRELRLVLAHSQSVASIARELTSREVAVLGVYFPGIDDVSHLFGHYAPPRLPGIGEEESRRYGDVIEEFYVYQDEVLGEILAGVGPEATVYVVSDHGFRFGRARPRLEPSSKGTPYAPQWHRDNGLLIVKGPGIRAGQRLKGVSIFDVVPTILAQLGIPAGRDMRGRVLDELFAQPLPALERVATHERPGWREETFAPSATGDADVRAAEALASRLQALGYLGAGDPAVAARQQAAIEAANLAGYYMQQGSLGPALEAAERAVQADPANYTAWRHLASLRRRLGDSSAAAAAIETAISLREAALEPRLFQIELLCAAGDREAARRAAQSLARQRPDVDAWLALGKAYQRSRDLAAALHYLDVSLREHPDVAEAYLYRGIVRGEQGAYAQALDDFERALDLQPRYPEAYFNAGVTHLKVGNLPLAIASLERAASLMPSSDVVLANLGKAYALSRDYARARETLDRALRINPGSEMAQLYQSGLASSGASQRPARDPAP